MYTADVYSRLAFFAVDIRSIGILPDILSCGEKLQVSRCFKYGRSRSFEVIEIKPIESTPYAVSFQSSVVKKDGNPLLPVERDRQIF